MNVTEPAAARDRKLAWSPVKIGWLSGSSRPRSNALSPEQQAFVESLPGRSDWKLRTNFPYLPQTSTYRATALPIASVINVARFAAASLPLRRARTVRAWRTLRESCDLLLLITNSCGSQIASALERHAPGTTPLRVLSLGPVDWGAKGLEQTRLRGSRDPVRTPVAPRSQWAQRAEFVIPGLGHMDYASSPQVAEFAREWTLRELDGRL